MRPPIRIPEHQPLIRVSDSLLSDSKTSAPSHSVKSIDLVCLNGEGCLLSQKKKKRLSEREGGQLLILPPEAVADSGEDGALSIRTPGSSLYPKGIKSLIQDHSPTLEKRVLLPFRHPTSAGDRQPSAAVAGYALCRELEKMDPNACFSTLTLIQEFTE